MGLNLSPAFISLISANEKIALPVVNGPVVCHHLQL
jgi:hypothetical protein